MFLIWLKGIIKMNDINSFGQFNWNSFVRILWTLAMIKCAWGWMYVCDFQYSRNKILLHSVRRRWKQTTKRDHFHFEANMLLHCFLCRNSILGFQLAIPPPGRLSVLFVCVSSVHMWVYWIVCCAGTPLFQSIPIQLANSDNIQSTAEMR